MAERQRGKLKIFMGYAAGVGKTYKMLEEAQYLKAHGRDVVIGYFEPHGRQDTIAKTEGLEIIPRKKIEYRGSVFEERFGIGEDRIGPPGRTQFSCLGLGQTRCCHQCEPPVLWPGRCPRNLVLDSRASARSRQAGSP